MIDILADLGYITELKDFVKNYNQINNSNKVKMSKGIFNYVNDLKRDRIMTLFTLGRPLWAAINEKSNIIDIAKQKLITASSWNKCRNQESAALAILAARTNLFSSRVVLNYERASILVASHCATLYNINELNDSLKFRYVSEPILAEAAAQIMNETNAFAEILNIFDKVIKKAPTITDTGMIGELVAQIILLAAKDKAAFDKYNGHPNLEFKKALNSLPITVEEFFIALLGRENYKKKFPKKMMQITSSTNVLELKKAILSFSHISQKFDVMQKTGLFLDFLGRNAAGAFKKNFPLYDVSNDV
jgi:hypothetical protein